MKKHYIIGLVLFAGLALSACAETNADESFMNRLVKVGSDKPHGYITIFKDKETGCQYFKTDASYGGVVIEPVLTEEGKPYCPQK